MTPITRRLPPTLLPTGAAFIAALRLIPRAVFARSDSTAPTNLATRIVEGGVALSRIAPAENAGAVTGYEVLRRQGGDALLFYLADTQSAASYTPAATIAGEQYNHRVQALRGNRKSERSNLAKVNLPQPTPEPTPTLEPTPRPEPISEPDAPLRGAITGLGRKAPAGRSAESRTETTPPRLRIANWRKSRHNVINFDWNVDHTLPASPSWRRPVFTRATADAKPTSKWKRYPAK